jgi:predicted  nucleic acid-binding Zn-ribbon protein
MVRKSGQLRWLTVAAAVMAVGALALWTGSVPAQEVDALEASIADARQEAQGIAAQIESNEAALAAAQAEAAAAAQREAELTALLAEGREREAELTQRVAEAEARLAEARAALQRALDALADRLVAIYKGDDPDAVTLILESDGFDDLTTRVEYLRRIEEADAELAARVRALRDEVAARLEAVEEARAQAHAYNEQLEAARAQIADARADAEAEAAALAAARDEQSAALASLQSQVDDWTAQVQELEAVSAAEAQQEVGSWVGDWAIPAAIVMCESGGDFDALNPSSGAGGAYQILPSTWESYGGEGKPSEASPQAQHEIAQQIWADSGPSAWVCAG